jgi:hypothetical protein
LERRHLVTVNFAYLVDSADDLLFSCHKRSVKDCLVGVHELHGEKLLVGFDFLCFQKERNAVQVFFVPEFEWQVDMVDLEVDFEFSLAEDGFELEDFWFVCMEGFFEVGPDPEEAFDIEPLLLVPVSAVFGLTEENAFGKVLVFLVDFELPEVSGKIISLGGHFFESSARVKEVTVSTSHYRLDGLGVLGGAHFMLEQLHVGNR